MWPIYARVVCSWACASCIPACPQMRHQSATGKLQSTNQDHISPMLSRLYLTGKYLAPLAWLQDCAEQIRRLLASLLHSKYSSVSTEGSACHNMTMHGNIGQMPVARLTSMFACDPLVPLWYCTPWLSPAYLILRYPSPSLPNLSTPTPYKRNSLVTVPLYSFAWCCKITYS